MVSCCGKLYCSCTKISENALLHEFVHCCRLHYVKGNLYMGSILELVHQQVSSALVISSVHSVKQAKHIQGRKMGVIAFDQCRSFKAFGTQA